MSKQQVTKLQTTKFILHQSKNIWKFQVTTIVLSIVTGVLFVVFTLALSDFVNLITNGIMSTTGFVFQFSKLLVCFASVALITVVIGYIQQVASLRTTRHLWKTTLKSINQSTVTDVNSFSQGDILTRVLSDASELSGIVGAFYPTLISQIVIFTFSLFALNLLSQPLSLIFLAFAPLFPLIAWFESKSLPKKTLVQRQAYSKVTEAIRVRLHGFRTIKALNATNYLNKEFDKESASFIKAATSLVWKANEFGGIFTVMKFTFPVIILGVGFFFFSQNLISIGAVFAFYLVSGQAYGPLFALGSSLATYYQTSPRVKRIIELLDIPKETEGGTLLNPIDTIGFDKVSFEYKQSPILRDVSFSLNKGEHVALVGATGSGKSTILGLLNMFYRTNTGKVFLNGKDIQSFNPTDIRSRVLLVSSNDLLINDTVRNNVAFFDDIADEELIKALSIARVPFPVDALITERSVSEGERQRICLARCLVRRPDVLLLDEALSGVDSKIEFEIFQKIMTSFPSITLIVVSHRLSTMRLMDKLMFLSAGALICEHSIDGLLQNSSEFRSLIEKQLIHPDIENCKLGTQNNPRAYIQ
ncbi:MAG: ABC transporter ATP-binding protein/permease [Nitrososphaerota archaeon]|jgi:ABC-type multidrug transport system fused ATPase/permease subunit|nr:ABC transporter ATP-binding protein/permease [Nitrososphaerota archaeon]